MKNSVERNFANEIEVDWFNPELYSNGEMLDIANNEVSINVNEKLAMALQEVADLQSQLESTEMEGLSKLCKDSVIDTITAQFGLAGAFLTAQDGGNITTTHNFEKGIVSTDDDARKCVEYQKIKDNKTKFSDVRKERGYDNGLNTKRKETFQKNDIIIDRYTGRQLPKDGTAHIDHIISAKEIETNARNNLHLLPEERAKMATNDRNLAFTNSAANQSKSDKKMGVWLNEKELKTGKTKAEKYGIDKDRAMREDANARKYVNRTVDLKTFKNYSNQVFSTGGKEAGLAVSGTLIGVIIHDFTVALFEEIHIILNNKGTKAFSELFSDFKTHMQQVMLNLKEKWKEMLSDGLFAGITAFFSNLVVFIINLFATTLKKIVYMIRVGFVSLAQAIRLLAKPPTNMSPEEVRYQALKIMTTGLISALALGLSAAIEKLLQAIPGLQPVMMISLPFSRGQTVSDAIAAVVSGIIGGMLSTIVIYFMDKFRNQNKQIGIKFQLVAADAVATQYKIAQTWLVVKAAEDYAERIYKNDLKAITIADDLVKIALKRADNGVDKLRIAKERALKLKERDEY